MQQWAENHDAYRFYHCICRAKCGGKKEDDVPWMHDTVVEHGTREHNNILYKIDVIKKGCIIT